MNRVESVQADEEDDLPADVLAADRVDPGNRTLQQWRVLARHFEFELVRHTETMLKWQGIAQEEQVIAAQAKAEAAAIGRKYRWCRAALNAYKSGEWHFRPRPGLNDGFLWPDKVDEATVEIRRVIGTPAGCEAYERLVRSRDPLLKTSKGNHSKKGAYAANLHLLSRPARIPPKKLIGRPSSTNPLAALLLDAIEKLDPDVYVGKRMKSHVRAFVENHAAREGEGEGGAQVPCFRQKQTVERVYQLVKDERKKRNRQR